MNVRGTERDERSINQILINQTEKNNKERKREREEGEERERKERMMELCGGGGGGDALGPLQLVSIPFQSAMMVRWWSWPMMLE